MTLFRKYRFVINAQHKRFESGNICGISESTGSLLDGLRVRPDAIQRLPDETGVQSCGPSDPGTVGSQGVEVASCDTSESQGIDNFPDPTWIFSESEMIRVGFGVGLDSTSV